MSNTRPLSPLSGGGLAAVFAFCVGLTVTYYFVRSDPAPPPNASDRNEAALGGPIVAVLDFQLGVFLSIIFGIFVGSVVTFSMFASQLASRPIDSGKCVRQDEPAESEPGYELVDETDWLSSPQRADCE